MVSEIPFGGWISWFSIYEGNILKRIWSSSCTHRNLFLPFNFANNAKSVLHDFSDLQCMSKSQEEISGSGWGQKRGGGGRQFTWKCSETPLSLCNVLLLEWKICLHIYETKGNENSHLRHKWNVEKNYRDFVREYNWSQIFLSAALSNVENFNIMFSIRVHFRNWK